MRKHGRKDANQNPLVRFGEALGASFQDTSQFGNGRQDGIFGIHGHDFKVEFKDPKGALTPDQSVFIATWRGSPVHVLRTEADVERLLGTVLPQKRVPKRKISVDKAKRLASE